MRAREVLLVLFVVLSFLFVLPIDTATAKDTVLDIQINDLCLEATKATKNKTNPEIPTICDIDTDQSAGKNVVVGPDGMLTRFTQVMIWISGSLALIVMIISGLMFMFSSGNAESAARAKRTMLYAVIGMIVAVVGQIVVTFVLDRL